MKEHLFSGTALSDDIFARIFAGELHSTNVPSFKPVLSDSCFCLGLVHPLIQLMYGLEWEQPAIIAQGLAQAAIHKDTLTPFLVKAEKAAAAAESSSSSSALTLPELLDQARSTGKLSRSARWQDSHPLNGVLELAEDEALELVSKIRVEAEALEERTAEMMHTAAYVAAAAAFREPYRPRMDFFLM